MSLCGMPCCDHGRSPVSMSGVTACETECSVRASEPAPAPISSAVVDPEVSRTLLVSARAINAFEGAPVGPELIESQDGPAHAAPLHLLNSIFRI